jgi:hypothetical protein
MNTEEIIVDKFLNALRYIAIFLCAVIFGNYLGDQQSFKDCVTKKEAKLFNGTKIICNLKETT